MDESKRVFARGGKDLPLRHLITDIYKFTESFFELFHVQGFSNFTDFSLKPRFPSFLVLSLLPCLQDVHVCSRMLQVDIMPG